MINQAEETSKSRESALETIKKLRHKYGSRAKNLQDANEAETRLLLIDTVLSDVLGWPRDEFNPEKRVGQVGYIDYLLTTDRIPRLVVEAKRVSHTFGSPRSKSKRNHYQLRYFRTAYGPAFTEVLEQAERYVLANKVPFAVLTNGAEWILVQLIQVPGFRTIDDLKGVYFGNILSEEFRFDLFWENLYQPFVQEGVLETYFADLNVKEAEYSRIPQTQLGDFKWQKLQGNESIQNFYHFFFGEITDPGRRKMLELCYVTNTDLKNYQGELQRTLRDTAPAFLDNAEDISPEDYKSVLSSETGDQKGRVVLITGSVGCGKSTFVTKVLVESRHVDSLVTLKIDLIDEVGNGSIDIEQKLWKYLRWEWENKEQHSFDYDFLKEIFHKEIEGLKRGPRAKLFGDTNEYDRAEAELLERLSNEPEIFFQRCWRRYRQKSKGIIVFFDNVDRASEDFQKHVYSFAHKLARLTGATVIITMREFTFFRGKEAGFLDIRSSDKALHLQSPNLVQVLSKRIQYIENRLGDDHRISNWRRRDNWSSFQTAIQSHAEMLKKTFLLSREGSETLGVLDAIAWHDVRYFLNLLRQLHLMLGSSRKAWECSEIIGALMIPQSTQSISPAISNIYSPPYPNYRCYFLKIRVLLMLQYGQQEHETRSGTSLGKILGFLELYGYQELWSRRAVEELVKARFLECLEAPIAEDYTKDYELKDKHSFRPSPLGTALTGEIISSPTYLSLLGNSLPFHNRKTLKQYETALVEVYGLLNNQRLERDALDLFVENKLGHIVARYLVKMIGEEQAPPNLLNYIPEIGSTEDRLNRIIDELRKFADIPVSARKQQASPGQLPLPFEEYQEGRSAKFTSAIPIPDDIEHLHIGRSQMAPLIFWALVFLRKNGHELAFGVEITKVINEYLVDDHNKKEPNNISRALRSETLQSLPWLETAIISQRRKGFSLATGWETHWVGIFGAPIPVIGDSQQSNSI